MRVVNAAAILFVLTISAWKCGQANAAPSGFWNNDEFKDTFKTDDYFNTYKHQQEFSVASIFTNNKAVLNNDQTLNVAKETEDGHGSSRSLWSQSANYGTISAKLGISINTTHAIHGLGELDNGKRKDRFDGEIRQQVTYGEMNSDGPIIVNYNQIRD